MIRGDFHSSQRGMATMFVTMVLLILITLMVITAYSLSDMNLKTVGNLQTRKEAFAAAEKWIEQNIDGQIWNVVDPDAWVQPAGVDIDNDTIPDYQVTMALPVCQRATPAVITTASSVTLPGFSSAEAWNTVWVLDATAINDTSGTRVRVRQGVRVLLSEANKNLYCDT